jgi:hypothetical protein
VAHRAILCGMALCGLLGPTPSSSTERRPPTPQSGRSVGHRRIVRINRQHHSLAGDDGHVVQLRPNAVVGSCALRRVDSCHGSAADIIGADPEEEADDWALCNAVPLIAANIEVTRIAIVLKQAAERLDRAGHPTAVTVFCE